MVEVPVGVALGMLVGLGASGAGGGVGVLDRVALMQAVRAVAASPTAALSSARRFRVRRRNSAPFA
jgi:hypothetical protein